MYYVSRCIIYIIHRSCFSFKNSTLPVTIENCNVNVLKLITKENELTDPTFWTKFYQKTVELMFP